MTTKELQSQLRNLQLTHTSRSIITNIVSRLAERVFLIALRFATEHPQLTSQILLSQAPIKTLRKHFEPEKLDQTDDDKCITTHYNPFSPSSRPSKASKPSKTAT